MANENYSNEEKTFLIIASLGAIAGFILPLIMWALKKGEFSDYTKKTLADILNFELILLIISVGISVLPIAFFRWILPSVVFIINLVIALRCFAAVKEGKEFIFPINVQLLK